LPLAEAYNQRNIVLMPGPVVVQARASVSPNLRGFLLELAQVLTILHKQERHEKIVPFLL
ncbi:hypothetical protein ACQ1QD_11760, partial [Ornithobacterium rhinotracheale]